jgi:hypothetical protein
MALSLHQREQRFVERGTVRVMKQTTARLRRETAMTFNAQVSTISQASVADAFKVRLGGCAPSLATADAGKVRLGGCAPTF